MRSRRTFLQTFLVGGGLNSASVARHLEMPRSAAVSAHFPHYIDIAQQAGLKAKTIIGGERKKPFILESTGGGVALFDYDNDGWLDIFLVNGWRLEGFAAGEAPVNHLYRNNRDGTFTDVTRAAGLDRSGWGQGVCVGDYNNDGNLDLFITYYGQNVLYRNNGNGTFTDVTRESGLFANGNGYYTGAAFVDYDRDGKLDLFVTSYTDYAEGHSHDPKQESGCNWKGVKVFCGPRGLRGGRSFLFRNNGDGTFSDVSEAAGIHVAPLAYGFTPLTFDYNNDGWADIYVACDSSRSLLFRNNKNGTFSETGLAAGVAYNEDGREQAGMGVAAADYDGDGWLDIVKTNFADDTSTLYRNRHDGTFDDVTFSARIGANTTFLGWGTGFFDFDNDGWPDIFIANGHVYPEVDTQLVDSRYAQRKILYRNCRNGSFEDISEHSGPAVLVPKVSRGVAFGDLFNSGRIEIVVNNMNDTPSLLHDTAPCANHALGVQLTGEKSNRNGIGARVTAHMGNHQVMDEVRSGGSFCSQNDLRLHFGLGPATAVDKLEIRWPSGQVENFGVIAAGQHVVIKEGAGVVQKKAFQNFRKYS